MGFPGGVLHGDLGVIIGYLILAHQIGQGAQGPRADDAGRRRVHEGDVGDIFRLGDAGGKVFLFNGDEGGIGLCPEHLGPHDGTDDQEGGDGQTEESHHLRKFRLRPLHGRLEIDIAGGEADRLREHFSGDGADDEVGRSHHDAKEDDKGPEPAGVDVHGRQGHVIHKARQNENREQVEDHRKGPSVLFVRSLFLTKRFLAHEKLLSSIKRPCTE